MNQIWCLDHPWKALMFSFYLLSKSLKLLNFIDIYNQILLAWYFLWFHPWTYTLFVLLFLFQQETKTPKVICYPSVMSRITLVAWNAACDSKRKERLKQNKSKTKTWQTSSFTRNKFCRLWYTRFVAILYVQLLKNLVHDIISIIWQYFHRIRYLLQQSCSTYVGWHNHF